jgi:hypothetical protein
MNTPLKPQLHKHSVNGSFYTIQKGGTSFCDGHGTRFWRFKLKHVKRNIEHYIETFDNDLRTNKKYHCWVNYGGCIGSRYLNTDNFREAVNWMFERLENYR